MPLCWWYLSLDAWLWEGYPWNLKLRMLFETLLKEKTRIWYSNPPTLVTLLILNDDTVVSIPNDVLVPGINTRFYIQTTPCSTKVSRLHNIIRNIQNYCNWNWKIHKWWSFNTNGDPSVPATKICKHQRTLPLDIPKDARFHAVKFP